MDLRALLFTTDGGSSATLCQVLTELGIEAEICPEMLVAAGRLTRENYDALIVDWSNEADAVLLLKTARDRKAQSLNLVLVSDEASIARALQQGANSVIMKPIDVEQAHDTLSTARDLILSRRSEQRDKEARNAAAFAAAAAAQEEPEGLPEMPVEEPAAPKSGFLAQTNTRSAFEAEERVVKPEYSGPSNFQVARGPASLHEEQQIEAPAPEPVSKKRWDDVRSVFRETSQETKTEPVEHPVSQDSTGVFSSPPEEADGAEELAEEPTENTQSASLPSYLVIAVVACLLVAGVLYVWAPGGSYLGRATSILHAVLAKVASGKSQPPAPPSQPAPQVAATEAPAPAVPATDEPTPPASTEEFASDAGPIPSTEVDPNKIQIIETKAIPKAGAQQPPSKDPVPDTNTSQTPLPPTTTDQPVWHEQQVQNPPTSAVPEAMVPPPAPRPAPAPESPTSPGEGRVGVIIPDSLKNSPSPAPASSLEPSAIPEETSLGLLVHKVDPDYPPQALQQHLEGPVVLQAWISKDGSVRDLKLVKGYFVLGRAAFDAVKQWRFKPYSPNGRPVDFRTMLTVSFRHPN